MKEKGSDTGELEDLWENLKLTEEECSEIDLGEMDAKIRVEGSRSLIGKVWVDRQIGKDIVEKTMARVWRLSKPAIFKDLGSNSFVISFATHVDKERVMDGRLWLFDNQLFTLKLFDGMSKPQEVNFESEVFWIQMLNLPLGIMNEDCGRKIGSSVGRVVDVDVPEDGIGWGRSLRVRIEVPLRQAVARGRTVNVEGNKVWVKFKYEKLPRLCFDCGWLIHDSKGCRMKCVEKEEKSQFGAWLRAERMGKEKACGAGGVE
ncbi:uncharacterized protein At4g02000-like [Carya illinoinensis]|uniref:uncharacterized protein At4g02000-like n=1 Tax=Carya illinoinensis TaxID=32201 RepID=UPI001C71C6C7|nr:uncharacterized protein At4g02000-like [Carya illinoinensis]